MGSTGTPVKLGGGIGAAQAVAKDRLLLVLADITMSASYATGGDTVTLDTDIKGKELRGLIVLSREVALNRYAWDNVKAAPKIVARVISTDAEVANTTNLSTVTLTVLFIYEGA